MSTRPADENGREVERRKPVEFFDAWERTDDPYMVEHGYGTVAAEGLSRRVADALCEAIRRLEDYDHPSLLPQVFRSRYFDPVFQYGTIPMTTDTRVTLSDRTTRDGGAHTSPFAAPEAVEALVRELWLRSALTDDVPFRAAAAYKFLPGGGDVPGTSALDRRLRTLVDAVCITRPITLEACNLGRLSSREAIARVPASGRSEVGS